MSIQKVDVVQIRNKELMSEIQEIFKFHKGRYGVRRVYRELVNRGHKVNHKRVQRLMHEMRLLGKRPKKNIIPIKAKSERLLITS